MSAFLFAGLHPACVRFQLAGHISLHRNRPICSLFCAAIFLARPPARKSLLRIAPAAGNADRLVFMQVSAASDRQPPALPPPPPTTARLITRLISLSPNQPLLISILGRPPRVRCGELSDLWPLRFPLRQRPSARPTCSPSPSRPADAADAFLRRTR